MYLNNTNIDSLKTVIDDALKSYDNIKNEIRWLQKKLDLSPLNSDSNKEPDSEGNTGTGGNSGSEGNTGTGGTQVRMEIQNQMEILVPIKLKKLR